MIVWYVLLLIMSTTALADYMNNRGRSRINSVSIFMIAVMAILVGMRGEMGLDTASYIRNFNQITPFLSFSQLYKDSSAFRWEPLYVFSISIFRHGIDSYNSFIFVQAVIVLIVVSKSLKRIGLPINAGLYYFFLTFYLHLFEQQRMAVVYAILLLASTYIATGDLKKFLLSVLVAAMYQYTALLFLPAYWITKAPLFRTLNSKTLRTMRTSPSVITLRDGYNPVVKQSDVQTLFTVSFLIAAAVAVLVSGFQFSGVLGVIAERVGPSLPPLRTLTYYIDRVSTARNNRAETLSMARGIIGHSFVLIVLFVQRKYWCDSKTINWFFLYLVGLVVALVTRDFVWISHRFFSMYRIGLVLLFSTLIKNEPVRFPYTAATLWCIGIYEFLMMITRTIGPFRAVILSV